ncbi:hypothetical protein [Streptomyces sp. NPDC004134]|uniref:hypothetical protein n=1 Tax=Streptomyces sp. NPDC004134 TaxID=3364691 RepID=UPI00369E047F
MPTATTAEAETDNPHPPPGFLSRHRRTVTAVLTATALAAAALLGYTLTRGDDAPPEQRPVPTAPVTYTVDGEGTAQITYVARSTTGAGTTVQAAALPWRKTVRVPLGKTPTITLVLSDDGSEATCTLSIRGNLAQRATATGPHGRATCSADFPRQNR